MQNPPNSSDAWHGTTILTVRKGGIVAIGGDGQVSIGQTIVKANARKVRRLTKGDVIGGFAGASRPSNSSVENTSAKRVNSALSDALCASSDTVAVASETTMVR